LGLLLFTLLEGYSWVLQKTVLPNFLRETGMRLFTTLFILLYFFRIINFHVFMMLFSMLYLLIAIVLLLYLIRAGQFHFTLKASRVTKKFRKKMLNMQLLMFGGIIVTSIGQTIDGMIISSLLGLTPNAIYSLALYTANLIQIPQRSMQTISMGVLVRMWKDKNMPEIKRIYERSSINMLLISLFIFGNILLNITDGLQVFHVQDKYSAGIPLLLVFGIIRIIDAGTGVNAQVIAASNFWRFEFFSGVIMLALRIPLSYIFIKNYGIIGSAYGDIVSLTVYNFIRFEFLRRRFRMQPFTVQTIYSILLAALAYFIAYFLLRTQSGWFAIIARTIIFSGILVGSTFLFKLTPDAMQLVNVAKKRLKGGG
jgi:O-antigen/teichoic acid export membrane protein